MIPKLLLLFLCMCLTVPVVFADVNPYIREMYKPSDQALTSARDKLGGLQVNANISYDERQNSYFAEIQIGKKVLKNINLGQTYVYDTSKIFSSTECENLGRAYIHYRETLTQEQKQKYLFFNQVYCVNRPLIKINHIDLLYIWLSEYINAQHRSRTQIREVVSNVEDSFA